MGVKGLWRLIEEAGTPVPLESLENKILAVDVSIWLHQAVRGFRGVGGDAVANSHLLTLFHRICKLLFYRIKPVFVFDGGVPHLKKQTQSFRRVRREAAANRADCIRERLLNNLLKSHAVRQALGKTGPAPSQHRVLPAVKPRQKDMFELPPLPEGETLGGETVKREIDLIKDEANDSSEDEFEKPKKRMKVSHHKNLHNFDLESEEFRSLPIQKQHELLVELQDSRKDNSWASINSMPSESSGFASYQMERLLKRFKFQETMDNVRSAIQKEKSDELEKELLGDLVKHVSQTHKIASEDAAHSILITKKTEAPADVASMPAKVDNGKSPMKKPQKDFLQELMKEGIIGNPHRGISDSEESSDEDTIGATQMDEREKDDALVQVMNYAMSDNNGLTQDEIFSLIQQTKQEVDTMIGIDENKPSTSRNASGVACSTEVESEDSDDEDFVEVPEHEDQGNDVLDLDILSPSGKTTSENGSPENCLSSQEYNADGNNIDAIRSSKSSSLYIKIVQHRLDDVIPEEDTSPRKAKIDTRKLKKVVAFPRANSYPGSSTSETGDCVRPHGITLSIDVTQPKLPQEDIFADVFSTVPRSLSTHENGSSTCVAGDQPSIGKNKSIQNHPKDVVKMSGKSTKSSVSPKSVEKVDVPHNLQSKVDELVKIQLAEILMKGNLSSDTKVPVSASSNSKELKACKASSPDESFSAFDISGKKLGNRLSNLTMSVTGKQSDGAASSAHSDSSVDSPEAVDVIYEAESDESNDFIEVEKSTPSSRALNIVASSSDFGKISPTVSVTESVVDDHHKNGGTVNGGDTTTSVVANSSAANEFKERNAIDAEDGNLPNQRKTLVLNESDYEPSPSNSNVQFVASQKDGEPIPNNGVMENVPNQDFETPNEDNLKKIEEELAMEQNNLIAQAQKGDRIASNLSQQMYTDAQELLQLFGLPYLVAPMEAEAQCAFLDEVRLTNGTITDDSDAFLFGSKHVYKNFFNQSQHVELFKLDNIRAHFGLDREKLIALALLTGSDYTVGIEGIGAVSGMEILSEFPGKGIEILRNFKKWWVSYNKGGSALKLSKLREKFCKAYLPEGFPNDEVFTAYLEPDVDDSREKFEWSVPNTDALIEFTAEKLGWSRSKTNEILVPVMKRLSIKSSQTRIDTFFNNVRLVKDTKVTSKRLQEAIAKSRGEVVSQSTGKAEDNLMSKITREQGKRRKTGVKNALKKNAVEKDERDLHATPRQGENKKSGPRQPRRTSNPRGSLENKQSSVLENHAQDYKKPLSKEEKKKLIYEHLLLKKDEIAQRKAAELEMLHKKHHAALLLKKTTKDQRSARCMADLQESSLAQHGSECRPRSVKTCSFVTEVAGSKVDCALIDYSNRTFITVSSIGRIGNLFLVQRDSPQQSPLVPLTAPVYDVRCLLGCEDPDTVVAVRALAELLHCSKPLLLCFCVSSLPPRSELSRLAAVINQRLKSSAD
ncbi:Proteasome assembly chaperone 3 [Trinorchestia longiramus]|nr:Proteasome assembly chaperone 3 [Trinorchestia longiramus]